MNFRIAGGLHRYTHTHQYTPTCTHLGDESVWCCRAATTSRPTMAQLRLSRPAVQRLPQFQNFCFGDDLSPTSLAWATYFLSLSPALLPSASLLFPCTISLHCYTLCSSCLFASAMSMLLCRGQASCATDSQVKWPQNYSVLEDACHAST
jgi:hypothetical protein